MALVFGVSVYLYSQFWPETLTGIFTRDADVIAMGATYLHGYSIDCVIVSFVFCINSYFSGQGNSWFPMIHSLIATFLFRIPPRGLSVISTLLRCYGWALHRHSPRWYRSSSASGICIDKPE